MDKFEVALAALAAIPDQKEREECLRQASLKLKSLLRTVAANDDASDSENDKPTVVISAQAELQMLSSIRDFIKDNYGWQGTAPGEKLFFPEQGQLGALDEQATAHVDSFLLTSDDVTDLVACGDLHNAYCASCGSTDINDTDFLSHSMSLEQLHFIFTTALPQPTTASQPSCLVDVGCRLGAVLYAAHHLTSIPRVVGVEINEYYCKLARRTADHFQMSRIEIIQDDVLKQPALVRQADIIIMHNVFEFFGDEGYRLRMWQGMKALLTKTGALLITCPSLEVSLMDAGLEVDAENVDEWAEKVNPLFPQGLADDDEYLEEASSLHFYRIK
eukprot:TRINITY_DN12368_c0_g1_i10.p2 TRINITY_DN12368_c0_g1~~TRINITY_DN12368_c0_g1_i10.p2  ORF type:complete len:331 (+),score=57.89 TRINITY_DN12368_c0_g1_i10:2454-3446(+)